MMKKLYILIITSICVACQKVDKQLTFTEIMCNRNIFELTQSKDSEHHISLHLDLNNSQEIEEVLFDENNCKVVVDIEESTDHTFLLHMNYYGYSYKNQFLFYSPTHFEDGLWVEPYIEVTYMTDDCQLQENIHYSSVEYKDYGVDITYTLKLYDYLLNQLGNEKDISININLDSLYIQKWNS